VQLKAVLNSAIDHLTSQRVPSPRMNAELLLMFILDCDRAYLYAHSDRELSEDEQARYKAALDERARGVPAQYITGHQEFWGLDLIVTPAVLIPRPETEHVVESILEVARRRELLGYEYPPHITKIVDVGTGSGCIALALAKELTDAEIHATDISHEALEIARANTARLGFGNRIHFHQADLLEDCGSGFDFVVSNPPYVGESEEDQVQMEVRKFEPRNAVFAGPTGLETIDRLIPQAYAALHSGGWLVMEISGTIAQRARDLLRDWDEISIAPDLQSIPRVLRARKP
jgi:release factor glutamine methyltransferase